MRQRPIQKREQVMTLTRTSSQLVTIVFMNTQELCVRQNALGVFTGVIIMEMDKTNYVMVSTFMTGDSVVTP